MKFIQLTLIAILFTGISAFAQQKAVGKATIKVPGLHCDLDKDRVERSLFKAYGIGTVKAEVKKKTVTVTWLTDRTNIEEIKTAIANAGYDADDVTAEESMQKRLPAACKPVAVAIPPAPVVEPVKKVEVIVPPVVEPNKKPVVAIPNKKPVIPAVKTPVKKK